MLLALNLIGDTELPDRPDTRRTLNLKPVGEIHGPYTAEQTFVASHNGLSRIEEEALRLFRENDVSYLYIGKQGAGIDLQRLVDGPYYRIVYDHQGGRIFAIHYDEPG